MAKRDGRLRWFLVGLFAVVGGWALHTVGGWLIVLSASGSQGFLRLLVGAYAALALGFLFSFGVTRFAPRRRYRVAVLLVFVSLLVAATLMLEERYEASPIPAVLFGISLVIGAVGQALRMRGFSETVSGRELP